MQLHFLSDAVSSYLLIFAAEFGDKSQLVCMALAAKYRAMPVMLGAALAFLLLNTLAVAFGTAIANWLPEIVISSSVALMFALFAYLALTAKVDDADTLQNINGGNVIIATFLLICVAEFADKTQLAVVALSSNTTPLAVWCGATLALLTTTALGIWAGRNLLKRISMQAIHKLSGVLFLFLAFLAAIKTYQQVSIMLE